MVQPSGALQGHITFVTNHQGSGNLRGRGDHAGFHTPAPQLEADCTIQPRQPGNCNGQQRTPIRPLEERRGNLVEGPDLGPQELLGCVRQGRDLIGIPGPQEILGQASLEELHLHLAGVRLLEGGQGSHLLGQGGQPALRVRAAPPQQGEAQGGLELPAGQLGQTAHGQHKAGQHPGIRPLAVAEVVGQSRLQGQAGRGEEPRVVDDLGHEGLQSLADPGHHPPWSACHISWSRSAVQITGSWMPRSSS